MHLKEASWEKMPGYKAKAEKVQDEPGISFYIIKEGSTQRMMESRQKDTGISSKGVSPAKSGTIWASKYIMIAINLNP